MLILCQSHWQTEVLGITRRCYRTYQKCIENEISNAKGIVPCPVSEVPGRAIRFATSGVTVDTEPEQLKQGFLRYFRAIVNVASDNGGTISLYWSEPHFGHNQNNNSCIVEGAGITVGELRSSMRQLSRVKTRAHPHLLRGKQGMWPRPRTLPSPACITKISALRRRRT